ncbi:CopG family ribbon-helix-helix protein [Kocuria sp. CPCC 205300]|uniref:CopG family ribbon-helix-helix protein n=1 Tax=Kocuria sabuli TaxID=3071448 RepID=UPI0036DF295D
MAHATAPVKVDQQTDQRLSQAAHFLGRSKKSIVDEAVTEYIENHRAEIDLKIREALATLDGSDASAISMLTGISPDEIDELGGMPEDS